MKYNLLILYFLSDTGSDYGIKPIHMKFSETDRLKIVEYMQDLYYYVYFTDMKIFLINYKYFDKVLYFNTKIGIIKKNVFIL